MTLDTTMSEKIEAIAQLLHKTPDQVLDEALESYVKQERDRQLEADLVEHKKETTLSFDEFWDDVDFE